MEINAHTSDTPLVRRRRRTHEHIYTPSSGQLNSTQEESQRLRNRSKQSNQREAKATKRWPPKKMGWDRRFLRSKLFGEGKFCAFERTRNLLHRKERERESERARVEILSEGERKRKRGNSVGRKESETFWTQGKGNWNWIGMNITWQWRRFI